MSGLIYMIGHIKELIETWYNLIIALLVCCLGNKNELAILRFIGIDTCLQFDI